MNQKTKEIDLLIHQARFLQSRKQYLALIGGFGSGKSYGLAAKLWYLVSQNQGFDGLLLNRSYSQLMDALIPEVLKVFDQVGWVENKHYRFKEKNKLIINWRSGQRSTVHLRTTENKSYERIAGLNCSFALIDEIDTMPYAEEVWSFVNDRVRIPAPVNQIACSSTPEGFGFLQKFFEQALIENPELDDREIIRACTLDNPHISTDYVEKLIATRDPRSLRAYIFGEFVNLSGNRAYWGYSSENLTDCRAEDFPDTYLHIGIDFNAGINATEISVIQNNQVYVVDEVYGSRTVEDLMQQIDSRYPNRPKIFYPDSAGFEGVEQLKRRYGSSAVKTCAKDVRERVSSVNFLIKNGQTRRLFVNKKRCPQLDRTLDQQVLDSTGVPDKRGGIDHPGDAIGYFIHTVFPYTQPRAYAATARF